MLAVDGELDRALDYVGERGEWMPESDNGIPAGHFHLGAALVYVQKGMIAEALESCARAIDVTRRTHLRHRKDAVRGGG